MNWQLDTLIWMERLQGFAYGCVLGMFSIASSRLPLNWWHAVVFVFGISLLVGAYLLRRRSFGWYQNSLVVYIDEQE